MTEAPLPGARTHIPSLAPPRVERWVRLALGLALLVLAACTRGGSSASGGRKLALAPCRLEGLASQAQCGTYEVFEDRAAKSGRKIPLRVVVVPALAAQPEPDPLVLLAGGPGQAASRVQVLLALERIRRKRDIVLVDQRGTGDSNPLECEPHPLEAGLAARFDDTGAAERVRRCREGWAADVRHYTTPIAMDDLDEVRAALGYEKVNLWGVSYGTRAALVYMRQHPERVRTAILDGVAPMSLYLPLNAPHDGQQALEKLLAHCGKDAACAKAYPDLRPRTEALLARLEAEPARVRVPHPRTGVPEDLVLSRRAFLSELFSLLYSPEVASLVPLMLDRAERGEWAPFVALSVGLLEGQRSTVSHGLYYAVVCAEDAPSFDRAAVEREAKGTWFGPDMGLETLSVCEGWPRATLPPGYREPVVSDVPTLLLSGELDPVTPPAWAEEAKRTLSRSLHVVVPGVGHNTVGADCARTLMGELLERGSVEGLSPSCGPLSRPPFFTSFAGPVP
ncbi:alpha/beta hydrolase [Myxococcus sp. RHSTA-1-4]|uniref:alpha/beta hydrolase n=1 Tax=Myxococcus sp. RHSTA-1-4 TaxID=2874601 RepID=UPI001CBBCBFD|nr:alpha/beta hydrolase [Myxococcus sp. RHSTA-1-4]MBZ4418066.1 alpha/beta hydrolase [Myxococcus sp. RHSTA-1-4]